MDGAVLNTTRPVRPPPDETTTGGSAPRWKHQLVVAARILFLGSALGVLVWRLTLDAEGALDAVWRIGLPSVLGSFLAAMVGVGASGLAWRSLLHGVGASLNLPGMARVYFAGQIGKYIPGTVWAYLAHARLGREHGVSASRTTTASVLFVLAHTATGAVVAGLVLPFASGAVFHRFGWVALLAPLLLACLHPRLILPVLRWLHRVLGRGSAPEQVSGTAVLCALAWLTMTWFGYGLSMLLLISPVTRADNGALLASVAFGGFALAWTVGFLASGVLVVSPAGLGVREVALLMVLGPVVAGGGAAAAVVLLSRVVHSLADGAWALVGMSVRVPKQPGQVDDHQTVTQ